MRDRLAAETKAALKSQDKQRLSALRGAVRAEDEAGLLSELSNIARVMTSDTTCVVRADSTGDFPTIGVALREGAGCTTKAVSS